jgi:hypothetical protein
MIQARIRDGRVELDEPIPAEWEGQLVKISALTPDDPIPDLEERLAALHAMGPMEFDDDERADAAEWLSKMNDLSKAAMEKIMGKSS